MRGVIWAVFGLAAALAAGEAQAGFPVTVKEKCAVGGERFTYVTTGSYSTFGARPDGKPYGSWEFPLALPECPGNGLVMYREFTADEKTRLKPLLASDDYRALRRGETPYYRAAWLERALVPGSADAPWLLLQASWQADGDPARKARYQREFVEAVAARARPEGGDDLDWLALQARAVNAGRELGEFDQAMAQLKALLTASLDVVVPEETANNYEAVDAARNRRGWLEYLARLEAVIARRDASSEPLDMLPPEMVADRCLEMGDQAAAVPVCAAGEVPEIMAEMKKWREDGGDDPLAGPPVEE